VADEKEYYTKITGKSALGVDPEVIKTTILQEIERIANQEGTAGLRSMVKDDTLYEETFGKIFEGKEF